MLNNGGCGVRVRGPALWESRLGRHRSHAMAIVTWSALCLLLLGRADAAPCPYNASVDLDSLLTEAILWSEEQQTKPATTHVRYARCDPFYEGDIFLDGVEPWAERDERPGHLTSRVQLWPGGVIYYTTAVNDLNVLQTLNYSISAIESRTASETAPCVQFLPWSPGVSEDFLFITDALTDCCFSSVGRRGGNQTLNVGMKGNGVGNVKHLLMHALGFWHEHNRPGRDADIEVLWDNVEDGHKCYFNEYRRPDAVLPGRLPQVLQVRRRAGLRLLLSAGTGVLRGRGHVRPPVARAVRHPRRAHRVSQPRRA